MSKPKILLQLDGDSHASVFDSVVAVDAGVDQLLGHAGVTPQNVRGLVHGAMFTRGPADLLNTAIFVGGSDVQAGDALLEAIKGTFFGPLRVSVMMDANGANTTAAAAVLAASKHLTLSESNAVVLGGSGPVGQRTARLLAQEGAQVRICSRQLSRAEEAVRAIAARVKNAKLTPAATTDAASTEAALRDAQLVIAAGAAGVQLLSAGVRKKAASLKVAIDLNAVPPLGVEKVEPTDRAVDHDGVLCYGAIGVGGLKMKIHKAAIRQLFTANDQVIDAEEALSIGRALDG